jgi:hypothetical protein
MKYVNNYADGVPRLNLCKKGENGSPFYWWPFGARTINYRWETKNQGATVSYLYLVPNPVVWSISLIAVILSLVYFLMKFIFGNLKMEKNDEQQLVVVTLLYLAYMISIARIDRVMYTYHYFIPLLFSFVMVAKWIPFIVSRIQVKDFEYKEVVAQVMLMVLITCGWNYYRPFTYYSPISCADFMKRDIFSLWQMKPIQCRGWKDRSILQPIDPPPPPPMPQVNVISSSSLPTKPGQVIKQIPKSMPSSATKVNSVVKPGGTSLPPQKKK